MDVVAVRPVEEENLEINRDGRFDPVVVVGRAFTELQLRVQKTAQGYRGPQQADHQGQQQKAGAASRQPELLSGVRATSHVRAVA